MDELAFRAALGKFATGVGLATVVDPDLGPLAMTINSFSSVSLQPPLVLWSIQLSSDHVQIYTESPRFGISLLSADQVEASERYARRGGHQIVAEHFEAGPHGEPRLRGAIAHFSCSLHDVFPGGDHHIIVGEVTEFSATDAEPLLFVSGGYRRLD